MSSVLTPPDASTIPLSLSLVTVTQGNASKRLVPNGAGYPVKDPEHRLGISRGRVEHVQVPGLGGLRDLLTTVTSTQALVHGVPTGSTPGDLYKLVLAERYAGAPGTIARTLKCFEYPPGPRLLMLDHDPEVEARQHLSSAAELMNHLSRAVDPTFREVGWLSTTSTSSAIRSTETQAWLRPPEGMHTYLVATGDVLRFRGILKVRLWLAGLGYIKFATANMHTGVTALLERCMVDMTVFSPERLDYCCGAQIAKQAPFVQDRPPPVLTAGTVLDLDALPMVTEDEKAQYVQLVAAAKAALVPEQRQRVRVQITAHAPALPQGEVDQEIDRRLAQAARCELSLDHPLYFDHAPPCTAGTLTKAYDNKRLADPLEPDYGGDQAVFHWRNGDWRIVSFAHGLKRVFTLAPEAPTPPAADDDGSFDALIADVEEHTTAAPGKPLYADSASDPAASLGTVSPCTQGANAQRIHRAFEGTLHYTTGTGWVFWTGAYWRMDPTRDDALTTGFVSTLPTLIANEAQTLTQIALNYPRGPEQKAILALASDRLQWAIRSDNASALSGALKMAKAGLFILNEKFDAHPWLFNCRNGTVDLKTGTLGPHDPTHLLTRCAPVVFDPKATCPRWCRFVEEVFQHDMTMVQFLQRGIGWALTGVVQERALFFLYGPSGYNGKTTVVETIKELLGACGEEEVGYARKVDVGTFMHSKNIEENQRKMAALVGPRFVYTSEVDESHRLNEQLIKDITGNDTLDARRLYHETFSFKPTFKPWMYGNYKPDIRGTDDAIWGRVKLIPFEVSFKDRMDLTLADTLKSELSGILNWAIEGCLAWQKDGLQPPTKVEEATKAYRTEQDVFAPFITDMCDVLPAASIKTSRLWAAYKRWCVRNDQEEQSQTRLGNYLTAKGYLSDGNKSGHGAIRSGLDLKKEPDPPDEWDAPDLAPATPATPHATPSQQQVAALNGSNDAAKSTLQDELLPVATPFSGKSPESPLLRDFLEKGVATGSIEGNNNHLTRTNAHDALATPSQARGSNGQSDPAMVDAPPDYCPGCGADNREKGRTTWLIRPTYWECCKRSCGHRILKGA